MADTKQARKKKAQQEARADRFWSSFLFTENGKPKSSLWVYTFSLSIAFIAIYVLCYEGVIRLLSTPLAALPVWLGNGIQALVASAAGAAICCVPHRFFRDKRLVFGGHIWLMLYALAALITMLILLRGEREAVSAFLIAFGWFVALPVALGTLLSARLYRRDHRPIEPVEPEPEWKKYINLR